MNWLKYPVFIIGVLLIFCTGFSFCKKGDLFGIFGFIALGLFYIAFALEIHEDNKK